MICYVPVNNFSVMSGRVFLSWTCTKQRIKWLAQDTTQWLRRRWGLNQQPLNPQSNALPTEPLHSAHPHKTSHALLHHGQNTRIRFMKFYLLYADACLLLSSTVSHRSRQSFFYWKIVISFSSISLNMCWMLKRTILFRQFFWLHTPYNWVQKLFFWLHTLIWRPVTVLTWFIFISITHSCLFRNWFIRFL